jgi:purine-nucleoside phosphorylase
MSPEQYVVSTEGVLDDATLSAQRLAQATKMKAEAQAMLAEATRLEQEAASLTPVSDVRTKTKKTSTTKKQTA